MLVVKPSNEYDTPEKLIDIIAGEMLNKETSLQYWRNGVKLRVVDKNAGIGEVNAAEYNGYPRVVIGNVCNTIKASAGIIFVTSEPNDQFCDNLMNAVLRKEAEMIANDVVPLDKYHTYVANLHTNIKLKSQMKITLTNEKRKNNIKRLIKHQNNRWNAGYGNARFVWTVLHLRNFNEIITRDDPDQAILHRICSVLYDANDITQLAHGDTLTNYSNDMLKVTPNILKDSCEIKLNSNLPLLATALEGWHYGRFYTISVNIYSADRNQIIPEPVKTDEDGVWSTEICAGCRKLLYDDVYAFTLAECDLARPRCHMFCIFCAHGKSALYALADATYTRVLRITWPRTAADMIAQFNTPAMRPVLTELSEGYIEYGVRGDDDYFVLVGKNYVGVRDVDRFKFSSIVNNELISNRKIFPIYVI